MQESRRVRMTKKMLKESLLELMERMPFAKISIKDICANADLNRSTFYAYYESAESLLHDVEAEIFSKVPVLKTLSIQSKDAFVSMLVAFLEYVKENKKLFCTLIQRSEAGKFTERLTSAMMRKYKEYAAHEGTLIDEYEYIFCINGFIAMMKRWIDSNFPIGCREFAELALRLSAQQV